MRSSPPSPAVSVLPASRRERPRPPDLVLLIAVLLIAALLRLIALGSVPGPLSHDEAVKGYDAWSVLHTGRDQYGERLPLLFRAIGDYREAALPYLIALAEAVFGATDFAVRLPAALAGTALVGGAYLLGAELFGRRAGLAAAAFLAISPWHVQVSRLAFRAGLTPVCVTFGLWLLLRAVRRRSSCVPAGLVLGLSLHTYLGARAFLPLLLLGIVVTYRRELLGRPRATVAGAAALAAVAAPLVWWGMTHRADFFGHTGESSAWREAGGALPFVLQVGRKYLAYFGPGNLVLHGDPYPVPSTGRFGVLYWPELPAFAAGLALLARRRRPGDRLVLWWLLTFPLAPALTEGRPPDWLRSASGLPVFELITAAGAVALFELVSGLASQRLAGPRAGTERRLPARTSMDSMLRLVPGLFALALVVNAGFFLYDYAVRFPSRAAWAFHDGIADAVRQLAALAGEHEMIVLPGTIPAMHDFYLFYNRYDPRRLHAEGLEDPAPPGAWADVRGFGRVRICEPRLCCRAGAVCLVEGYDATLPEPVHEVRDRTGRVAYTLVLPYSLPRAAGILSAGRPRMAGTDRSGCGGDMGQVRLDIGCGRSKIKGTLGVDRIPLPGVDIVADLNAGLPFRDGSVAEIYTSHTLEHVEDFLGAMEELWRVCRPDALVHIWVPHASCPFVTWIDPTHRRGMTIETFSYFNPAANWLSYYSRARFAIVHARLHLSTVHMRRDRSMRRSRGLLATALEAVANRSRAWQYRAERWWGPMIGFDEAHVVLRAHKS